MNFLNKISRILWIFMQQAINIISLLYCKFRTIPTVWKKFTYDKTGLPIIYSMTQYTNFAKAFFAFLKYHTVQQYMYNCNLTYAHKKAQFFSVLCFMKLTNSQQHYVHVSCAKLKPNQTNVERLWVKYGFHCTYFHATHDSSFQHCTHLMLIVLSKSDKKYRRGGQYFTYVFN